MSILDSTEVFLPDADEKKDVTAATPNGAGGPVKANKGMILRKSVEYIRYCIELSKRSFFPNFG